MLDKQKYDIVMMYLNLIQLVLLNIYYVR